MTLEEKVAKLEKENKKLRRDVDDLTGIVVNANNLLGNAIGTIKGITNYLKIRDGR